MVRKSWKKITYGTNGCPERNLGNLWSSEIIWILENSLTGGHGELGRYRRSFSVSLDRMAKLGGDQPTC